MLLLLLPCLFSPSGFPQIEYVNGRTQQAFVSSSNEKGGGRDLLESEAAYAYCQSISQVKSLQVPLETTQSYFVQSVLTLLSSAPAYCLLHPVRLSLTLILQLQPPCEICLVICVSKMVCALKNGACHKWHSCGSKPNAENKQLLLNICTHTPHVPSASHFTYLLSGFVLHPRCQIASCSNWTH